MGLSHYKCRVFEPCHYNSSYSVGAITILAEFESCHYVRLTPLWAHVQAYGAIPSHTYLRMDRVALHRVDKVAAPFVCSQPPPFLDSISPALTLERRRRPHRRKLRQRRGAWLAWTGASSEHEGGRCGGRSSGAAAMRNNGDDRGPAASPVYADASR